jgi:small subunit ribosomal protein S17
MKKTITVRVERLEPHAKYGKYVRRSTVCKAHDENGEAKTGDTVEIAATRPLSKTKRWRLVRVVARAGV